MDSGSNTYFDLYAQDAALDAELLHDAYIAAMTDAATYRECLHVALACLADKDAELIAVRRVQRSNVEQIRQLMGIDTNELNGETVTPE